MQAVLRKWDQWKMTNPNIGIIVSLLCILGLTILVMSFVSDRFLTIVNIMNVLSQASVFLIMAVGATLVMTTSGIDIAVGSLLGLSVSILGYANIQYGFPIWATILVGLAVGALGGAFNGLVIVKFKVYPIIVTLGTWSLFRGLAYVLTGGDLVFGFPKAFVWISEGRILGIPFPVLLASLTFLLGYYLLHKTRFGSHITAIGGNEEAALLAGINVKQLKFSVYVIAGVLAGLAAVITSARLDTAHPTAGIGYELNVIAATVIGGTALIGGRGIMIGTLLGVIFLQVLSNSMLLGGVDFYLQRVFFGLIFILVVAIRSFHGQRKL